ncbi:MAG: PP2C family protein-serine/threonine phosphatase [Pseudodesulfovibrio sp.]|uniref:PP2C family protein-serine/threonine phosphatase n=1 Tax=Pseudodesulfovibrio sp. TaxID=2035812 RepID=UPI003D09D2F4
MTIRYKLLILLLFISLVPLLVVGVVVRGDLTRLGDTLAKRSENVLIHKASTGLTRIVKDQARVLGRERQLLESTALFLASKIEGVLYGHSHLGSPSSFTPSAEQIREAAGEYSSRSVGRMHGFEVDFGKLTVSPAGAESEIHDKLLPLLEQVKFELPKLTLWVEVRLPDGTEVLYPGVDASRGLMPMRMNMNMGMAGNFMGPHGTALIQSLQWSSPRIDSRTGRSAFRVTAPIRDMNGDVDGEASIVIPVDSLLGSEHQASMFSQDTKSFLVKVAPTSKEDGRIRIFAQERPAEGMGRQWMLPQDAAWLEVEDREQYGIAVNALRNREPMTVGMPYKGKAALWAFAPVDADGTALMLIVPEADVVGDALSAKEFVLAQVGKHNAKMAFFALGVCALVLALVFLFSKLFTRNIGELAQAVRKVAKGDFSARAAVRSSDEIGQLGLTFNSMVPELQERVAIKNSLEIAQQVQQNLLPKAAPVFPGADIFATSEYCDEIGGDYYGFIPRPTPGGDGLVIAVGDVSGHGIPAAVMMSSARAYLHCHAASGARLDQVVRSANDLLHADMDMSGRFMTLFLLELAPDGDLRWVRAGHDPALLYDAARDRFEELDGEGLPLGVVEGGSFELRHMTKPSSGSIIVVGTDGIWETHSPEGEMFGKDRLMDLVRDHATESSKDIIHALMCSLDAFRGDTDRLDDITIAIVKIM